MRSAGAGKLKGKTRWDRDKRALQEKHSECRKATGILSNDVKVRTCF